MTRFDAEVTIRRTRFASEQSGWAVVEAAAADGVPILLVGPLTHLEERERARVLGTWVNDSRYGPQVKVQQASPLPPTDDEALAAYLRRVRHVGAKRAAKLIERYGTAQLLEQIDADPPQAFGAVGLRRNKAREAGRSWDELRVTRRLHLLLAPHGLAYLVNRIHEDLGSHAHRTIVRQPYRLTSVFGVGFLVADRIARGVGVDCEGPARTHAAILHVLAEAERSGSTCMAADGLLDAGAELLGGERPSEAAIDAMVAGGALERAGPWIYRAQTAALEAELAQRVLDLCEGEPGDGLKDPGETGHEQAPELTEEQRAGVRSAFTHRLSLITGGPGTGKTASIRTIALLAADQGVRLLLLAPTGRAAVRMSEASGVNARTVHSALGWVPGQGPTRDEENPLPCELLIVDESSMANLELMVTLLRAVGPRTHVVLVGDADQLAPVGAGKPFADLVAAALIPTARLTHIFRQAAGSMIVQAAHAIRRGESPSFAPAPEMQRDLFLVQRDDPRAALQEIVSLVSERLPRHYDVDPITEIQVFAPVYKGELGIDALNEALRDALNPDGTKVRGGRLRIGDKLMMTGRNLHELGLMNGTLLRLIDEISREGGDDPALLLSAEEAVFRLAPEQSERLRLAYACSVHRGQGIELPVAVIAAHPAGGSFFLRREMLYTAITRARLATVIVGTREAIVRAARTADTGRRHSRLGERLLEGST